MVPLGGGGLADGVAAWCAEHAAKTRVVCVYPRVFGRSLAPGHISAQLHQPVEVSYCDGLGVLLVQETPLAGILDSLVADIVDMDEDEDAVAIAIAQVLLCQSLLLPLPLPLCCRSRPGRTGLRAAAADG